jgi:uncharacterized protein
MLYESVKKMSVIQIKVIPKAKNNSVTVENNIYKVRLTAAPEDGKANKLLIKVLANYFGCKKSQLHIVNGRKSRNKLVEKRI